MSENDFSLQKSTDAVQPTEEPIAIYDKKLNKDEYTGGMYFLMRKMPFFRVAPVLLYICLFSLFLSNLLKIVRKEVFPDGRILYHINVTYIVLACILLLLGVLFAFLWRFSLRRTCRIKYEQMRMTEDGTAPRQIYFYPTRLEIRKDGVCMVSMEYKNVRKIYYRKPLYLVRFSHMVMGIYREDGFAKGSFETVREAVRSCTKPDM